MGLRSECSADESVEDNEEISSGPAKFAIFTGKTEDNRNEFCVVENNDYGESLSFHMVKQNLSDVTENVSLHGRRIKREPKKGRGSDVITRMPSNSEVSSNKCTRNAELNRGIQGSVSSTNANSGFGPGPLFATGVDSEWNSRSSTSFDSASGGRVKIEKENSHSSLESDSRSSNFLFVQGTHSLSNRMQDENGDDMAGGEEPDGGGCEGGIADSSSEVKGERSENHGSFSDGDSLDKSLFELESAQEALKKELQKLKELGEDISAHDFVSDSCMEFVDNEQKTSSKQLLGEGSHSFSQSMQSEVLQTASRVLETEIEDLFKQKIEAEVEYMAISKAVQKLRVATVDQVTVLEEQKTLASEQTQMLDKLGAAENKASMLKKEAEKLESICQDIAHANEVMKLQKGVCKYSSYFLVQFVLFLVMFVALVFQLSPSYVEVVPT
ncbi:WPP domain-interacting protein 2 [Striga hermonthica]|uniref:WPP domain-interacting protein 2 n=1 Tax=Striga hermonthica TaxID=68872 RepID=A0A9N7MXY4_STRHE|nr:WPP domain-interacting protein 2 [Striga hermonthica]